MARRPFSSGFPGLRFRSGPLARSCCATPPIPARLILLFRIVKTDDASSPRRRTVTMAMYRHPELDSVSVKAPPLCYKSFASGPVEGWSLHSQRSVKRLVEELSLSLSKGRHFFANKPLRLIQLSTPTKLMTRLAKKNFTRTKSCRPEEEPSP